LSTGIGMAGFMAIINHISPQTITSTFVDWLMFFNVGHRPSTKFTPRFRCKFATLKRTEKYDNRKGG